MWQVLLSTPMSDDAPKSAFLDDQQFSVEEGAAYRVFRTGAIWMNKLFFGALTLLAVWLFLGLTGAVDPGCVDTISPTLLENGTHADSDSEQCSVWLSATAKYLGAMSVLSFLLSMLFGLFGLMVGKRILEMTPHSEETASRAIAANVADEAGEKPSESKE
jgi:hypothetical protein